jgi:hypothetical protein
MKCPECIKEDKRSCVTQRETWTTLMFVPAQWDEDGKPVTERQNNITKTRYTCSEGHEWRQ